VNASTKPRGHRQLDVDHLVPPAAANAALATLIGPPGMSGFELCLDVDVDERAQRPADAQPAGLLLGTLGETSWRGRRHRG